MYLQTKFGYTLHAEYCEGELKCATVAESGGGGPRLSELSDGGTHSFPYHCYTKLAFNALTKSHNILQMGFISNYFNLMQGL